MGLDVKALAKAQEDLKSRSTGSKNWIQASKIKDPIDFRIMDPLPSMDGIYYVEVPVWWINGTRVISPKIFGPGEPDPIQIAIDEAKRQKDPDTLKLLSAKDSKTDMPKIQYKVEFWVPVLKFDWKFDAKKEEILDIWDKDGKADEELIKNFIADDQWKILVTGIQALKAINDIATKRGGSTMTERVAGCNLILSKTGEKRDTKYTVTKSDLFPMPEHLYTPEKMIDPFELAQSLLFTNAYQDQIIGKYLYNEECPDKSEDSYEFPELREKFKVMFSEENSDEEVKSTVRARPGRTAAPATVAAPVQEAAAPVEEAAPTRSRAAATTAAPAATTRKAPEPVATSRRGVSTVPGTGRPQRNIAKDIEETE